VDAINMIDVVAGYSWVGKREISTTSILCRIA